MIRVTKYTAQAIYANRRILSLPPRRTRPTMIVWVGRRGGLQYRS